ncbi:hypothetical protein Ancab_021466 [Ancistrocladus abbreviatus]
MGTPWVTVKVFSCTCCDGGAASATAGSMPLEAAAVALTSVTIGFGLSVVADLRASASGEVERLLDLNQQLQIEHSLHLNLQELGIDFNLPEDHLVLLEEQLVDLNLLEVHPVDLNLWEVEHLVDLHLLEVEHLMLLQREEAWGPPEKPEKQLQHQSWLVLRAQSPSAAFCSKLQLISSELVTGHP